MSPYFLSDNTCQSRFDRQRNHIQSSLRCYLLIEFLRENGNAMSSRKHSTIIYQLYKRQDYALTELYSKYFLLKIIINFVRSRERV